MRSRLRPLLRESAARWRAMPARDRQAVGIAALVLALAFLWLVLTKPALDTVARWQQDLPPLRAQSAELDRVLAGIPAVQGQGGGRTPSEAPQAGLDRAGLQGLYRIHDAVSDAPPGAGSPPPAKAWRIEFPEPVPASQVFAWLMEVSARADVELTSAVLDRMDGPAAPGTAPQGRVRGLVDLQSTSLYKDRP